MNYVQFYRLFVLFSLYLPCESAHFSRMAETANISRKAAGSQQREGLGSGLSHLEHKAAAAGKQPVIPEKAGMTEPDEFKCDSLGAG